MRPQRPYLLKALYQWILDNDETPYVLVRASVEGVSVPQEHVENDQIVLNLSPNAVRDLVMEDEYVMCASRFGGRAFELVLPMASILAIYCRDSGEGMVFPEESAFAEKGPAISVADTEPQQPQPEAAEAEADSEGKEKPGGKKGKPGLRLV